ncbi:F-box protein [Ceratobasidium theobromae]|uniref:F-box protein n=1 Tax=Ceratobasidium theobromae TaxID=1582974 RepID=A0A5N5Q914_9AGAM|nr:F-box protein [Ceratobasidium theobromae]
MVTTRSQTKSSGATLPDVKPVEENPSPPTRVAKRPRISLKIKAENVEHKSVVYGLMDMPLETFTEISSHVHPGDLISLARTCKVFRRVLMKRSAEPIWRRAESNVPELPPYPWSNMCPPQYAALLFTKNCTSCGDITSTNADPFLLVRLCSVCRETEKKDAKKRPRGSGLLKYCLRKELEEIQNSYHCLSQSGGGATLLHWVQEIRDETTLRQEFGSRLRDFLYCLESARSRELVAIRQQRALEVEERLLASGWTAADLRFRYPHYDKWQALIEQPRPLTDRIWSNLLPKLLPLLEANRIQHEEDAKKERKYERQKELHKLLRAFKLETHPLAPMVKALGFEPLLIEPQAGPTPPSVTRFLDAYPFPDTPTALKWDCFGEVENTEMSMEEVKTLFDSKREEVYKHFDTWKRQIEIELWLHLWADKKYPGGPFAEGVKVKGDADSVRDLPDHTQVLLRADTIFSRLSPDSPTGQDQVLYHPELLPTSRSFCRYSSPTKISVSSYHPHIKARQVAVALLKCMGTPDAAYLELAVMGERFLCGRCHPTKPMSWKAIIQHFLEEDKTWNIISSGTPRFKTRHPIRWVSIHDLGAKGELPLVVVLSPEEADEMRAAVSQQDALSYCFPCKNYGRMYVSGPERMSTHLQTVHDVKEAKSNIHYCSITESGTFLENGGAWRDRWDTHHDECW